MTHRPLRRILLQLLAEGGAPVIVFDVDDYRIFENDAGASATTALAQLESVVSAGRDGGQVHRLDGDRFLVVLPSKTYDEAVAIAERRVDAVRGLAIPFARAPGGRLTVTAVVVAVKSSADVERFGARVEDLLRDGKSTGGDAIIRER